MNKKDWGFFIIVPHSWLRAAVRRFCFLPTEQEQQQVGKYPGTLNSTEQNGKRS